MIRTAPIARTGTLKQGKPMARGIGFETPAAGAGLLRVAAVQTKARAREPRLSKMPKPMASRGMKGRPPTADEARFMSAIADLGCVACRHDGWSNPNVSVHHIDGRTKPGAHLLVLPLCAGHHQDGTGTNPTLIAVHPYKARFEARYGTQLSLLAECIAMLVDTEAVSIAPTDREEATWEAC